MTLREFTILVYDLYEYAYLPVTIFAFIYWYKTKQQFHLFSLLFVLALLRIIAIFLAKYYINTIPIYHLIGVTELLCSFLIYRFVLHKYWSYFLLTFVIFYIGNSLFLDTIFEPNNVCLALVNLIIILFGVAYLKRVYQNESIQELHQDGFFFINAGFLIFAGGCFFLNLMMSKIVQNLSNNFFENAWLLEAGFGMIRLILITYGLILLKRES